MDQQELLNLISDIFNHYKEDRGERFAKAIGFQIAELPWDEQKRELLTIIAQLIDMNLATLHRATSGCRPDKFCGSDTQ